MTKKQMIIGRKKARRFIIQALYQWQVADQELLVVEEQFMQWPEMEKADKEYFRELLFKIPENISAIDDLIVPALDRELSQINPVEFAILRLGCYELLKHPELPYRIILNEGIELAKLFGAEGSHKYVNGVLHKIASQIREHEIE